MKSAEKHICLFHFVRYVRVYISFMMSAIKSSGLNINQLTNYIINKP